VAIALQELGRVEIEAGPAVDVAVLDKTAYVAIGGQGGGVAVVDIGDPTAPSVRLFRPVPSEPNKTDVEALATDGHLLFVGVDWYAGRTPHDQKEGPFALFNALYVLDAWDPSLPEVDRREVTGEHCGGSNACGPDGISELRFHEGNLFVAYRRGGVMVAYTDPQRAGAAPGFQGAAWYAVGGFDAERNDAYVLHYWGVDWVDLEASHPGAVEVLSTHGEEPNGGVLAGAVRERRLYTLEQARGLRVVDVSTPEEARTVGFVERALNGGDIVIKGRYALTCQSNRERGIAHLEIFDLDTPDEPRSVFREARPCRSVHPYGEDMVLILAGDMTVARFGTQWDLP
jgi:hypothetical protein